MEKYWVKNIQREIPKFFSLRPIVLKTNLTNNTPPYLTMKAAIREFKVFVVIFIFVQHVLLGKDKKRSRSVFSLMFIFNSW